MTPEQLRQLKGLIRAGAGAEWAAADAAYQRVEQMARRDWAVRVLDAWAHPALELGWSCRGSVCELLSGDDVIEDEHLGAGNPDAARLAAAEAVWPELPESVRAELGERP